MKYATNSIVNSQWLYHFHKSVKITSHIFQPLDMSYALMNFNGKQKVNTCIFYPSLNRFSPWQMVKCCVKLNSIKNF